MNDTFRGECRFIALAMCHVVVGSKTWVRWECRYRGLDRILVSVTGDLDLDIGHDGTFFLHGP